MFSGFRELSPNCHPVSNVPSGGCCKFIAGLQVDRLKQARGFTSRNHVKLFILRLFFYASNTRDNFFIGTSLIFLSGAPDVFAGNVTLSTPVFFIVSRESSTSIGCSHPGTWRLVANSYKRLVVQPFLSTSTLSALRLGHLGYHLGPGSSLSPP